MNLNHIKKRMIEEGLDETLISKAFKLATDFEGIKDLLEMLAEEVDPEEQDLILKDLKQLVDDVELYSKTKKPGYVVSSIGINLDGTYFFRGMSLGQGGTVEPSTFHCDTIEGLLAWAKYNLEYFDEYYKDMIKQKEEEKGG